MFSKLQVVRCLTAFSFSCCLTFAAQAAESEVTPASYCADSCCEPDAFFRHQCSKVYGCIESLCNSDDGCTDYCCVDGCCDCCNDFTPMMFGNADFRSSFLYNTNFAQPGFGTTAFGGSVGRTKVSEWNSARPLDRVFFNFDAYGNVPYGFDMDVERMMIGLEKTVLDGRASVMIRVPFAATQSASLTGFDSTSSDLELGSVDLTAKYLLIDTCHWDVSGGLLIGLPTNSSFKTNGVNMESESIQVTPFLAVLYERDRLFLQAFTGVAIDATGSGATFLGNPIGQHREQQVWDIDLQLGYWIVKDQCTGRGLAPFVEFHYTSPISSRDDTFNFIPGAEQEDFDDYVMGTGIQFISGKNVNGALAINLPLSNSQRRSADYQIGFRVEYRR